MIAVQAGVSSAVQRPGDHSRPDHTTEHRLRNGQRSKHSGRRRKPTSTSSISASPTYTSSATTTSSSGVTFYVQPNTDASKSVASLTAAGDRVDTALIEKIANRSQAIWLGEWNPNQTTVVNQVLTAANGSVPVFVLYAIPNRDCWSYSSGGYKSDAQYETFVNQIAAGVKGRQAWFILEPDALPDENSCLSASQRTDRQDLIRYASQTLSMVSSHVYLDAGDSAWQTPSYMAGVLQTAGVSFAAGFSLNVSAYEPTAKQEAYGNQLSALIGGKHFVIDTSRNGSGVPATTWCNAPNQLLGTPPTTVTDDSLADAYLWIKSPGQSDGNCGHGAPVSGDWWLSYALGLAGG